MELSKRLSWVGLSVWIPELGVKICFIMIIPIRAVLRVKGQIGQIGPIVQIGQIGQIGQVGQVGQIGQIGQIGQSPGVSRIYFGNLNHHGFLLILHG